MLIAAITTLLVAGLVPALGMWRRSRAPQLASPAAPATAPQPATTSRWAAQPDRKSQLRLRFNGECWIEVQTLDGEIVLATTLGEGDARSLPIGDGLRLLVGRPDLVEVAVGEGDFRTVGPIDRINWVVIRPPDAPEGSS